MTDALGDDIVIGNVYGYSQMSNGHIAIIVGVADGLTEKKVRINKSYTRSGIYGEAGDWKKKNRATSVYAVTMFPVTNDDYIAIQLVGGL